MVRANAKRGTSLIGWPHSTTVPDVCGNRPRSTFARVVFPHPDSPTSASTSPRSTVKSTPFTAFSCCFPRNMPREMVKFRVTPFASIINSAITPPHLLPAFRYYEYSGMPAPCHLDREAEHHFDGKHPLLVHSGQQTGSR